MQGVSINFCKEEEEMSKLVNFDGYKEWFRDLKKEIRNVQIKASIAVNSHLILFYYSLGKQIVEKQKNTKWGSGFIAQLSKDLKEEFPQMTGFSTTNLNYCKRFYLFYTQTEQLNLIPTAILPQVGVELKAIDFQEDTIYPQVGAEIEIATIAMLPWGHQKLLIDKCSSTKQALFYIHKTIENNWSRAVLDYQIEINLYSRQGKAITNFKHILPEPQSDLANEIMKSQYNFDFLQLSTKVRETDLEKALVQHISQFLPELGVGFAYMGRQFGLKVGTKDYRTDLLFYHTRLKCYVIIELKTKSFEPEFVGKLNFYINAVNELLKDGIDQRTIGILLCRNKDNYEVEFSLKDLNNPIGVSTFHYTELAEEIKNALPSDKVLQNELLKIEKEYEKR